MSETSNKEVIMYGTDWCPDCIRAKLVFRKLGVEYTYINTDKDEAAKEFVISHNNGDRIVPTILFPDGSVLVEPANNQITEKVVGLGLVRKN